MGLACGPNIRCPNLGRVWVAMHPDGGGTLHHERRIHRRVAGLNDLGSTCVPTFIFSNTPFTTVRPWISNEPGSKCLPVSSRDSQQRMQLGLDRHRCRGISIFPDLTQLVTDTGGGTHFDDLYRDSNRCGQTPTLLQDNILPNYPV
ncbi:hypothetical protein PIB30_028059 [Stylosanthes scabra]|uniref:Uncharacterized protein n=1 Tax=Stylosanthes scabra TaxID=79078 RepID=A0ABU6RBH7_9FABA|nr:hypothetical protein [Stylosanthes scabra]